MNVNNDYNDQKIVNDCVKHDCYTSSCWFYDILVTCCEKNPYLREGKSMGWGHEG